MWRALLVDDEESIRKLLTTVLEMAEFSVQTAESGCSAIELLGTQEFDVVITDLRMETRLAGYDVARHARQLHPRPLIVIVTAFPVPASEWKNAGADALFTKGLNTIQLAEKVKGILEHRKTHSVEHHRFHASREFHRDLR